MIDEEIKCIKQLISEEISDLEWRRRRINDDDV